jgi:hypothetical protein
MATARQLRTLVGGNVATVSLPTVKRTLIRQGRLAYRPCKSPSLNAHQRLVRLQWCRQFGNWTEEDWKKVGFAILQKYPTDVHGSLICAFLGYFH